MDIGGMGDEEDAARRCGCAKNAAAGSAVDAAGWRIGCRFGS
jgi:hypothetical protein